MFEVLADPRLYTFTSDRPPSSIEALADVYARRETRRSPDGSELWLNWLLYEVNLQRPVGYVQASVTPTHADVAWVVSMHWQGNGYASEAAKAMIGWLREVGVHHFRACIHPDHNASQRVAMSIGMRLTDDLHNGEQVWMTS
jgi:RimJ/RimL family protein N-acetyltransferase